jgi:hypothetical protein
MLTACPISFLSALIKDNRRMKMKKNAFDIIVVGAGIGGLGVAIALAQKGFKVRILESKGGLSEFGASINVLPSAVRVLKAWGLAEAFEPLICRLLFTEIRNGSNNHLTGRFLNNVDKVAEITYGEESVTLIINKKRSQKLRTSSQILEPAPSRLSSGARSSIPNPRRQTDL